MFFTSAEQRARHQYIDRSIEIADTIVRHPEMTNRFGEDLMDSYARVANNMYVPNVRHGVIASRKFSADAVPVVAQRVGEEIVLPESLALPHVAQRSAITKLMQTVEPGGEYWTEGTTDRVIRDAQRSAPVIKLAHKVGAQVYTQTNNFHVEAVDGHGYAGQILGRPVLALVYPDGYRFDPSAMVHEIEHVVQNEVSPLLQLADRDEMRSYLASQELRAYHVQAITIGALAVMNYEPHPDEKSYFSIRDGKISAPHIAAIEEARKRHNADLEDPFYPNAELLKELDDRQIGLTSI